MQNDKTTRYLRAPREIMEQMRSLSEAAGVPSCVYDGTNMDDLTQRLSTILVQSGGGPAAVVCYAGSSFSDSPRRVARFSVLVVSAETRVAPGIPCAMDAAWAVEDALDGLVTRAGEAGSRTTDVMRAESDDAIQLKDDGIACAVVVSVTVTDF